MIRFIAPMYKILRKINKKAASRLWRWAMMRYYKDPTVFMMGLVQPPHLWTKEPVFHWKEEQ